VGSSCDCGNEPLGSIKCGKLLSGYTSGGFSSSVQVHRVSRSVIESSYHCLYTVWFLSVSEETLDK
jgi:hypothetical protein